MLLILHASHYRKQKCCHCGGYTYSICKCYYTRLVKQHPQHFAHLAQYIQIHYVNDIIEQVLCANCAKCTRHGHEHEECCLLVMGDYFFHALCSDHVINVLFRDGGLIEFRCIWLNRCHECISLDFSTGCVFDSVFKCKE